jgi:predicted PhzF superfamily epimerase YddE/YHI9
LRWFTPTVEVDLCGHATLASGHVLGGNNLFHTRSGELRTTASKDGWIDMDFPFDPAQPEDLTDELRKGIGDVEVVAVARGVSDVLVQVATADMVRQLAPDFDALGRVPARGVIVTARGDRDADVVSRCFYPAVGVPEDPVTGSAHCTIGTWWCPLLGKQEILAEQLSPRGGSLRVTLSGDRVGLAGQAITMVSGRIEF